MTIKQKQWQLYYLGYYGGFARDFVASKFGKEGFDKALTEYVDSEIAKSDVPIILLLHSDDHLSFDKNVPDIENFVAAPFFRKKFTGQKPPRRK